MSDFDRQKWNRKFSDNPDAWLQPSRVVTRLEPFLPAAGMALDIAGGVGRHAIWLASKGLDVTMVDISAVGLAAAAQTAQEKALPLKTLERDLEQSSLPEGSWDVIFSHHFLYRPLFPAMTESLANGGRLIVVQPTVRNLERHEKPPRPFLLEDRELLTLASDLNVIHYEEGWLEEGRHEAVVIAEKA